VTCAAILSASEEISRLNKRDSHHRSDPPERNAVVPASIVVTREPSQFHIRTTGIHDVELFKKQRFCEFYSRQVAFLIAGGLTSRELHQITVRPSLSRKAIRPAQVQMPLLNFAGKDCKGALKPIRFVKNSMTLSSDFETHGLVLASAGGSLYKRVGWCHFRSRDELGKGYELRQVSII
jgi:hypothetical protein